jgi:hypothetical protein
MAVSSTIAYCSNSDLYEVYPGINAFDLKGRLYGSWEAHGDADTYVMNNSGYVSVLFKDGKDLGAEESSLPNAADEWRWVESLDQLQYYEASTNIATLNASIWESGVDFDNLLTNTTQKASRYFESQIDSRVAKEISKDREGKYPFIVIRCSALIGVVLLLKAEDPNNPIIESFQAEIDEIIEGIKSGNIVLTHQITADSSKGIIRDVNYTSGKIRPVELRGRASLDGFDNIKLKIITGGVIGTATYSVWIKNSDSLKINQVVTAKKINGDFQPLAYGLEVRFAGSVDGTTEAAQDDEFEIEVYGSEMDATISQVGSISLSRWR